MSSSHNLTRSHLAPSTDSRLSFHNGSGHLRMGADRPQPRACGSGGGQMPRFPVHLSGLHSKEYPYQGSKAPKGASNSASFAESWPSTIRSGEPRALHVAESRLGPVSTHSLEAVSSAPPIQRVSPAGSPNKPVAPAERQSSPLFTGDGPLAETTSRSRRSSLDAPEKSTSGKRKKRPAGQPSRRWLRLLLR